jgi:hypothetical protein
LLVTNSFSGPDRMDNLLKDHRCPRSLAFGDLGNHKPEETC